MFKKLKQRIEEGDQQPVKIASSTPKKTSISPNNSSKPRRLNTKAPSTTTSISSRSSVRSAGSLGKTPALANKFTTSTPNATLNGTTSNGHSRLANNGFLNNSIKNENKWEKRRRSSIAGSRESLTSVDSGATTGTAAFSRISYGGGSSTEDHQYNHYDSPVILENLRDGGTKEEVLSELKKKSEKVKTLENKINELSSAFIEQGKQRDRLEEALENIRNEMLSRSSNNESFKEIQEEYEQKLKLKDQQIKEYKHKHQESMHSTAELVAKSMKIEHIEKEYKEQKLEFETLQRTLNELSKDRSKYETQIKQLSMQNTTLEKEKSALKSELSHIINELTQKSTMVDTLQVSADKAHEDALSFQQSYNIFKAKAVSDLEEKDVEVSMWKKKIYDLQEKLDGSKLSENDQIKALEKENRLLEKKLQEAREQVVAVRNQSNQQIDSLNSLVDGLEKQLDDAKSSSKNNECESHMNDTLRTKVCILKFFLIVWKQI